MGLHSPRLWCSLLGKPHRCPVTIPFPFIKLTVYIPLDAPRRKFQGFVDLLQDSLQLLLLGNLWLGDLSDVQLLTLEFLWGDKGKRTAISFAPHHPKSCTHTFTHSLTHQIHSAHLGRTGCCCSFLSWWWHCGASMYREDLGIVSWTPKW